MKWYGKPGAAFLDRWTVVHLAFWLVVGANMEAVSVPHAWRWPLIIAGAIFWEVLEEGLERYSNLVAVPEGPLNRWVSDPIMGIVGGGVGMYLIAG